MRLFVAVHVPETLKIALQDAKRRLETAGVSSYMKWVLPENLHLTLKFLGETDEKKVALIKQALARIRWTEGSFEVKCGRITVFPVPEKPRVVVLELTHGARLIEKLASCVEESMTGIGFPGEKRAFRPHLTLARVREGTPRTMLGKISSSLMSADFNVDNYPFFSVRGFGLYESILRPEGPLYRNLENYMFQESLK